MHSLAIAMPIKPGKTEAWKQYVRGLDERWREERDADYRRFGVQRNAAWLQKTPNGDLAIIYWEVEDPELHSLQFKEIMSSNDEYYTWVRDNLTDIFGFDPNQDRPPLPELVADYRLPAGAEGLNGAVLAVAVPVNPGKADDWKQRTRELMEKRRSEVESDWRRFGIHRGSSWLQETPEGELAILYWELDDPRKLTERTEVMMTSGDDYYMTLRESLADIFDFSGPQSRPVSELVADYRLDRPE